MTRTGTGLGATGTGTRDDKAVRAAKKMAQTDAEARLRREFECVPCLNCGKFQDQMVAELKRRRTRLWFIGGLVCGFLALPPLGLAVLLTRAITNTVRPPKDAAYTACGIAWVCAGLLGAAAIGLLVMWRHRVRTFDPYEGKPEDYWIDQAMRLGAVTPEELEKIETRYRERNPEYEPLIHDDPALPEPDRPPPAPAPWAKGQRSTKAESSAPPPPPPPAPSAPEKNPFDFG
jgi:hypothetical protein